MKVSKRRTRTNTPPIQVFSRRRVDNTHIDTTSKEYLIPQCIGLVSRDLLSTSFLQIRQNIWYSVLPKLDETSDVASGMRQKWADIERLMIHCGLLKKNSKTSNGYLIIEPKWDEFCQDFPGLSKLHFVISRKQGEPKQYHLCLGKPLFCSPTKQNNAVLKKKFAFEELSYKNAADRKLTNLINNHITKLSSMYDDMSAQTPIPPSSYEESPSNITPSNDATPSPADLSPPLSQQPIQPTEPSSTPTHISPPSLPPPPSPPPPPPFQAQINFALALNLTHK